MTYFQKKSATVPRSTCRICGHDSDRVRGTEAFMPKPGDLTVCINCGAVAAFADDLTLRAPTDDERNELPDFALKMIAHIKKRGRFE